MIDPALHYGHPELDLGYLDLVSPVPDEVLDGYKEMASIDVGFREGVIYGALQRGWELSPRTSLF